MKTKHSENYLPYALVKRLLAGLLAFFISLTACSVYAQSGAVKGRVLNSDSLPVAGASVAVKGTGAGTTTDEQGNFSITMPAGKTIITVSYIGYQSQEIDVSGNSNPQVILSGTNGSLNDVVVVGYGTQRRANLTGSVVSVNAKQIEERPVTNLTNALQGTMAGVTIVTNQGRPGADRGSINIRGIGTLNNSNPLVVVDGIISSLNDVNPNDVQSVSVLKDAASAAIYGSRAANGVVLITTKKGKKGRLQVDYDGYAGKQKATAMPEFLPSWQAATLYNQARANEGQTAYWSDDQIQQFKDGSNPDQYPNTDWLGLLYSGSGFQQNHYVNVSGGDEKTVYAFSLGYFGQDGIVKKTDFSRYTTRFNINSAIKKNFNVFANIAFQYSNTGSPAGGGGNDITNFTGTTAAMSSTVVNQYQNGVYNYLSFGNPIAWLNGPGFSKAENYLFTGNMGLDWEILSGLHLRPSFIYRYNNNPSQLFSPADIYYSPTDPSQVVTTISPAFANKNNSLENYTNLQMLLSYEKTFSKHTLNLLAGSARELTKYSYLYGYRQGFLNNALYELNAAPTLGQAAQGTANDVALLGFFGRANYSFDDKYLFEANFRYDGSSRFGTGNRWGAYPSFSAGWNIDKENFFTSLTDVVSAFKLRASWGKLGNQNIGSPYPAVPVIASGINYSFNETLAAGIAPVSGANEAITWETTTNYGAGLDMGFFKNKLNLTVDYYVRNTDNILLQLPVSQVYGFSVPYQNAGSVKNAGWEFTAGYSDRRGDFSYNISANAAFNKNRITDLSGAGSMSSGYVVGYPIRAFYGYVSEGIFQTQEEVDKHAKQSGGTIAPGDIMYKDISGPDGRPDGVIDGNDRTYIGTPFPGTTYGFSLGGGWKGLELNAFFQGAFNVKNYVQGFALGSLQQANIGNPTPEMLDAWTPQNTDASFPRLWSTFTQNNPQNYVSSFWVRNASYLRLKSLTLSYTLPGSFTSRLNVKTIRVYYGGQNILTSTQFYKWIDPETTSGNGAYNYYPQVLTHTIGLHVTF